MIWVDYFVMSIDNMNTPGTKDVFIIFDSVVVIPNFENKPQIPANGWTLIDSFELFDICFF